MYVFFLFFPFFSQKARTSAVEITHLPLLHDSGASRHVFEDVTEMRDVTDAFFKTLPTNGLTVIQVEHLENPALWDMYVAKTRTMKQRDGLERVWLFYGTDEGTVP